jgi:hypothetical protein
MASQQISDYLIYKNDTIPIYHLILENPFNECNNVDCAFFSRISFDIKPMQFNSEIFYIIIKFFKINKF